MKVIITENQLNNVIERILRKSYPNIVSVFFTGSPVKYYGGKDGGVGEYTRININIILDTGDVLKGNLYDPKTLFSRFTDENIKKEITKTLKSYLNIQTNELASPYGINVYTLVTKEL